MNYRTERLGKVKRRFEFFLLLISIFVVFNFGLLSAGGEELNIIALNVSRDRPASFNEISSAVRSSSDWESPQASGFRLKEGSPSPRIFTPNGDTSNEKVTFEYENIEESSIVCWIYDIKGTVVRQLDIDPLKDEFSWDGTNENNDVAPSGIYIYQIEVEGQTINGTIVLAK
ncbi:MAG: FlgD immunoglobulin-like domain containing protein [bacterium]